MVVRHRLRKVFCFLFELESSNLNFMLRNLVVFPTEVPPLIIFFAFPLILHVSASSGDRIIATPPLAQFVG